MKKTYLILFSLILCIHVSSCRNPLHSDNGSDAAGNPGNAKSTSSANPAAGDVIPTGTAVVEGKIEIESGSGLTGNIFVFIIDQSKLPEKTNVISSIIVPSAKVKGNEIKYELKKIPAGQWNVMAVWDTSPPYCKTTETHCNASARDMYGSSELFEVKDGGRVENVVVKIL